MPHSFAVLMSRPTRIHEATRIGGRRGGQAIKVGRDPALQRFEAVSYTHLTLPTNSRV